MTMEADIFFSRLHEFVLPLRTFLALSQSQVKPEMGMAPMRRKQAAHRRDGRAGAAAQHILPAMQQYMIPHCTNCLEL
ncbi:hypothetical protein NKI77_08420 [Mesorhizobium opportunistum]|uniref:Uncharacterized protein n=2 Tax=Phyllobacteriaceae TaxID=69277 RepID=A0ABV1YBZ7_9HYPH|nr:hypothetical protein [Mesorhizobium sp.]TIN95815.1 MAG: hypothetical protein E5Y06_11270 [Mesorhizobium sp.]TJU90604.1 MAG: hypothetical protein E5Y12_30810 [Mesorhizobium sp.]TJU98366.1 MAG: hypothetical protein E5Y08_12750 [Mesorhizobium sp.]TJV18915.1 MAG: hypothetical protein E5Y07_07610 [Mesorhizobium sp.]TJV37849.1 MAG: hypothetical protein E5Y02_31735 [Mesorhizobium sp.]